MNSASNAEGPGRGRTGDWRARLAADLAADREEERRVWGDVDDVTLARYDAGQCTDEERAQVERAMRDFPAVREATEIARQFPLEREATSLVEALPIRPGRRGGPRPDVPPVPPGWTSRSLRAFGVGMAASLLIGAIGLLARQQAITGGQLARSRAELARLHEQIAAGDGALAAQSRENAALRRQAAAAEDLGRRLGELTAQLEKVRNKPAWPPTAFLLTGDRSTKGDSSVANRIRPRPQMRFLAWLRRSEGGEYAGFFLLLRGDELPIPLVAQAKLTDESTILLSITDSWLTWPELTRPDASITRSTPPPNRLTIDIGKGTFSGTLGDTDIGGKIMF
jgi:hypothetical protein